MIPMADRPDHVAHLRVPGLPCPECEQPIVVEALTLLAAKTISCASCGLELSVNMDKSAEALGALENYMQEFERIQGTLPLIEEDRAVGGKNRRMRQGRTRTRTRNRTR